MKIKCSSKRYGLVVIAAVFTSLLFELVSMADESVEPDTTVLAQVNGTTITKSTFDKRYQENLKFFPLKPPSHRAVLDDLIKRELGIQEAKRQGIDKDPQVVDRINTVLYHALLEKELSKAFEEIQISDEEAKNYYLRNPEIRTSHVFVALRQGATADEEKDARDKMKKIQEILTEKKMTFAEVAQRFSEDASAPMGGDIDFQSRERLDPLYYETALKLKEPGKMSSVIRTQFGLDKIKLTSIRSWDDADKPQNKRRAFEERRTKIYELYMDKLKKKEKNLSSNPELLPD